MNLDPREALVEECRAAATLLAQRREPDFAKVTNCPPWTLKELTVHIWGTVQLPPCWVRSTLVPASAADYYRRAERKADAYRQRNVDHSQQAAERHKTGADAVRALSTTADALEVRLASEDLDQVIEVSAVGAMRLHDYLVTRVASVAIHGVDIAITLDLLPFTTANAERITADLVESLVGVRADSLGWTSGELISRGSGRTGLTETERDQLGELAAAFPSIT